MSMTLMKVQSQNTDADNDSFERGITLDAVPGGEDGGGGGCDGGDEEAVDEDDDVPRR